VCFEQLQLSPNIASCIVITIEPDLFELTHHDPGSIQATPCVCSSSNSLLINIIDVCYAESDYIFVNDCELRLSFEEKEH
jgi:hypothetical protein